MKKKFVTMLCFAMVCLCGGGILAMTTGCGQQEYDMTNFAISQNEFDYNGTSQNLKLTGIPEGLDYNFTYYLDQEYQTVDQLHQDAGTYYVKISFVAGKGYKTPEEKYGTMTINKVAFSDVTLNVGARYVMEGYDPETVSAKENPDGSYYFDVADGSYNVMLLGTSATGVEPEVSFYADEELTNEKSSRLQEYGSELYMAVNLSDKNHLPTQIVKKVSIQEKIVEIRDFEDLKLMRTHIYGGEYKGKQVAPASLEVRKHFKYVLMNDIDCGGQPWTPVQYIIYGGETINNNGFVSELNGNSHTISDYKITLDSIDQDAANEAAGTGTQTLYLGLFGYVRDAKIHDFTLRNIEMSINKDDPNFKMKDGIYVIAGNVAGRVSSGGSQDAGETDIYKITVENSKIDINVTRQSVGGIIGEEYANQGPDGRRDHLAVKNSEIYAYSTAAHKNIFVGGITGYTVHDAPLGTDFGPSAQRLKYSECSVEDIKIGLNYEALAAATSEEEKAKYKLGASDGQYNVLAALNSELMTDYAYEVGALFGRIFSSVGVENGTVKNYLIAITTNATAYTGDPKTGFWGFASEGVAGWDTCTYSQDTTWNGGVNGVYGEDEAKHDEYERWDRSKK